MPSELAFEVFGLALEATRGTPITPPTHLLNMTGTIVPIEDVYVPPDQVGELAEAQREEVVRKSGTWQAAGAADVTKLPLLGNMVYAPVTAGVASGGEVTSTTSLVGGTGYVPATQVDAFAIGVGAPAAGGRQAVIYATTSAGIITSLRVADPGSHYTSAPALTFTGHTGTGASATAVVSATATIAQLWEFVRAMTVDNLKAATAYWGDPNVMEEKAAFAMATQLVVGGDASGTDGVTSSIQGISQFPSEIISSFPTLPAISVGPILVPGRMQLWVEPNTTNAFGTTAVTGRVISAEHTTSTGVIAKYVATGPTGGVTYDHVGRQKVRPQLKMAFELIDNTQTALFVAGTTVKARVRFNNGTLIEAGFYPFVEFDIEGKLRDLNWTDLEGTNRAVEFTIMGVRSAQLASDSRMRVQNSSAVL